MIEFVSDLGADLSHLAIRIFWSIDNICINAQELADAFLSIIFYFCIVAWYFWT